MQFTHFPLHAETPQEGLSLEELFAGRSVDRAAMKERITGLMVEEGLPYGERTHTYNSRLAQELGKWAEGQPDGERIHDVLFRTYFVDTMNISNVDVLVDAAERAGLDGEAARAILNERSFSDAVDEDWKRSLAVGVTGVPTFVVGPSGIVGAQPYEALENLLQNANAAPRIATG